MLKIIYTNKFKKDYTAAVKCGYDITKLATVIPYIVSAKACTSS